MKTFILAAGLGSRLDPLQLDVPKVMVPIGGKPLIAHHLELLSSQGFTDILINLHHKAEKVVEFLGDGTKFGVTITYSREPELRGTSGAVKKMSATLRDAAFMVFYGDNLVSVDLRSLVDHHQARRATATIALYESQEPWTGGVVDCDADGRVTRFREKPPAADITSNQISAGIFVLEPRVLESIPSETFSDFGKNVIPDLLQSGNDVYAKKLDGYIRDIGTPERLSVARNDFESGRVRHESIPGTTR